jgi:hypothetical protein
MFREIRNVTQNEKGVLRRWFSDDYFDLVVWTDEDGVPIGFQLAYDVDGRERALTYLRGAYRHAKIDTGEDAATSHKTPILVADGVFDTLRILDRFAAASDGMDRDIRDYVIRGIEGYGTVSRQRLS